MGDKLRSGSLSKALRALTLRVILLPLSLTSGTLDSRNGAFFIKHHAARLSARLPQRVNEDAIPRGKRSDPFGELPAVTDHGREKKKIRLRRDAVERKHAEHPVQCTPQARHGA